MSKPEPTDTASSTGDPRIFRFALTCRICNLSYHTLQSAKSHFVYQWPRHLTPKISCGCCGQHILQLGEVCFPSQRQACTPHGSHPYPGCLNDLQFGGWVASSHSTWTFATSHLHRDSAHCHLDWGSNVCPSCDGLCPSPCTLTCRHPLLPVPQSIPPFFPPAM